MLSPDRASWPFEDVVRRPTSNSPFEIIWTKLLEGDETMVQVDFAMMPGDTVIDRITLVDNVSVFWLSGGSASPSFQKLRVTFTASSGQSDAIDIPIRVLA